MNNAQHTSDEIPTRTRVRIHLIRGSVAIVASAAISVLITMEIANPWPNLKTAYIISAAVAVWGLIDLVQWIPSRK